MRWIFARWLLVASGGVFIVVSIAALWGRGSPWRGEWQWTFDNVNGTTVLLGPLAAGVAAWAVQDLSGHALLIRSSRRGPVVPAVQILAVWCWAAAAWACAAVTGVVGTLSTVHGGPAPYWVLIAGPVVLAAYTSIGGAIGELVRFRVAAVGAVPAVFVTAGIASGAGLPNLLRQGPGTSTLAGLTWSPRTFSLEMAGLVALTILCIAASAMTSGGRSLARGAAIASSSVAFVALLVVLMTTGDTRFVPSREAATACSSGEVVVCVAPSNVRALAGLSAAFRAVAPRLRAAGVPIPREFREILPNSAPGSPWGVIDLGSRANDPSPGVAVVVDALATPRGCAGFSDLSHPPPADMFAARAELMHWFLAPSRATTDAFHRWAIATYRQLLLCRLSSIHPIGAMRDASAY